MCIYVHIIFPNTISSRCCCSCVLDHDLVYIQMLCSMWWALAHALPTNSLVFGFTGVYTVWLGVCVCVWPLEPPVLQNHCSEQTTTTSTPSSCCAFYAFIHHICCVVCVWMRVSKWVLLLLLLCTNGMCNHMFWRVWCLRLHRVLVVFCSSMECTWICSNWLREAPLLLLLYIFEGDCHFS